MFENHYNSETNTNEAEYIPAEETQHTEKKKKGKAKKIIKTIAAFCCVAALSVGSIAGYRYYKDNGLSLPLIGKSDDKDKGSSSKKETEEKDNNSQIDLTNEDYSAKSLSQLSKSEGALTTQEIYKKCLPSVVGITSTFEYTEQPKYNFFGYSSGQSSAKTATCGGTGIVMSEDGYIITNAHVIYDSTYKKATKVSLLLSDEKELDAEIVGYDEQADVAVLKADTKDTKLTPAEFGDSDAIQVGDYAVAIGNPLTFDLFGTLTVGYISGVDREISVNEQVIPLIQTDAAINSGNSGGPLINDKGQVVGINSMKLSNSYSSSAASIEGLGFAIPINEAREIVDDLIKTDGKGSSAKKTQIGITCRDISAASSQYYAEDANADVYGVLVTDIVADGPAAKAGIKVNDIIVGADGESIQTVQQLNAIKAKFEAGQKLSLTVIRDRQYISVDIVLEEVTEEAAAQTQDDSQQTAPDQNNGQQTIPDQNSDGTVPDQNGQGSSPQQGSIPQQIPGYGSQQGGQDPFEDFNPFEGFENLIP